MLLKDKKSLLEKSTINLNQNLNKTMARAMLDYTKTVLDKGEGSVLGGLGDLLDGDNRF